MTPIYTVGDIRPALAKILDHYPTVADAYRAAGVSCESFYRIRKAGDGRRVKGPTALRILTHAAGLPDKPVTRPGAITWAEVAEYAKTPEGRAFVAQCWAPRRMGAAA
ncbi:MULTISPECIES: hypothetical protein [unclassified Brevibacterium]|uniref:hypothetical protein n=1 Tax=unclassified Brevibacterium TaxID=2614124 RepID=UPI001E384063|nr:MULTISPECIES: hypothetical protein [unclassified Brevibacterium]MCD1287307.1 hypothetical protein [Brevibacterium sp. CCUG 69071]MDK8436438.1 hypothetical protein [Brevibacterium sp. H-BE7]